MKRPQGLQNSTRLTGAKRPPGGDNLRNADTAPIPVIAATTTLPARKQKQDSDGPATRPPRAAPEPNDAKPVESPSVRAAARRRRRYERAEIKRFTRASRRRRLAWLIGAGSVVVVLAGAILVSVSPLMALRSVQIVGAQRVDAAAVRKALDSQLGTPLPLVNYDTIRKELTKFPLIRSYSTEANPPGTLVVRLIERVPIALLKVPSGYQLVDQAGVVMQTTAERPGGYPLISIPEDASEESRHREFDATAGVLAALPVGMLGQVGSASSTGAQDVTLVLTSGVTVVWGGPEDAALKSAVLATLLKSAPGASVYDVSAPKSPVTR